MREGSTPPNMSRVTCHEVSLVTCHMSFFYFIIFFFGQIGEVYPWRVCYQQGLPRLVFRISVYLKKERTQILGPYNVESIYNIYELT